MERMPDNEVEGCAGGRDEVAFIKLHEGVVRQLEPVTHRNVERFVCHWIRGLFSQAMLGEHNLMGLMKRMYRYSAQIRPDSEAASADYHGSSCQMRKHSSA